DPSRNQSPETKLRRGQCRFVEIHIDVRKSDFVRLDVGQRAGNETFDEVNRDVPVISQQSFDVFLAVAPALIDLHVSAGPLAIDFLISLKCVEQPKLLANLAREQAVEHQSRTAAAGHTRFKKISFAAQALTAQVEEQI